MLNLQNVSVDFYQIVITQIFQKKQTVEVTKF